VALKELEVDSIFGGEEPFGEHSLHYCQVKFMDGSFATVATKNRAMTVARFEALRVAGVQMFAIDPPKEGKKAGYMRDYPGKAQGNIPWPADVPEPEFVKDDPDAEPAPKDDWTGPPLTSAEQAINAAWPDQPVGGDWHAPTENVGGVMDLPPGNGGTGDPGSSASSPTPSPIFALVARIQSDLAQLAALIGTPGGDAVSGTKGPVTDVPSGDTPSSGKVAGATGEGVTVASTEALLHTVWPTQPNLRLRWLRTELKTVGAESLEACTPGQLASLHAALVKIAAQRKGN
jgi:hypothetical protein